MPPASSTVPWTQVQFLKSSSSLLRAGSTRTALESWTNILVCCCFGVTLGDLIKEIAFRQLSGRTWPGARGRRAFEKTIFGAQGSLARPCPSRTPIASAKYLENIWCCWPRRCLYSADLTYKYLSTFLNCPMSFYNMLVAIFNLFPAFKVIKEEIKTLQT